MLETLADHDDLLMEQLLEEKEPPRDEVFDDLSADLRDGSVTPVLIGTAEKGNGVLQAAEGDPPRCAGRRDDAQAPRRSRRQRGRRAGDEDDPYRAWRQAVGVAHPFGRGRRRLRTLGFVDATRPRSRASTACSARTSQADPPRPARRSRSASSTP